MPAYAYRARNETGNLVKGTMDAASAEEVTAKLHKMGYIATAVSLTSPGIKLSDITASFLPVRAQDLVIFNFQLANMIESGIPILSGLRAMEGQIENKKLREIIAQVRRNIEAGNLFSASLSRHPATFSKLLVSMVKAGEESGKLDKVLKRYALYAEAQLELREKIKGVLFYPAILLVASCLVIVFIVSFIIPQFVAMFTKAGIQLPLTTRILFLIGVIIREYWYMVLIGTGILVFGIRKYLASQRGKFQFDRMLLGTPVIGLLARKIYISRFSRTLATLLSSGVPILHSLDITKEIVANAVIAGVIVNVRGAVEQGQKIAESLKISQEFPADTIQMVAAGEETGNLEGMLDKIADFYDMATGYAIKKLTAIIEPVFLLIMGGIIAFIMASMLLPIFDIIKILRH